MTEVEALPATDRFEPTIIVFACNWCSYAGADMAGVSRKRYPVNVRIIRVMCTGRIDPTFILKAYLDGADGVLIAGCHPGDCHYLEGNLRAKERIDNIFEVLKILGWEVDRLRLEWISASEGKRFANIMSQFTEQIRALGPVLED